MQERAWSLALVLVLTILSGFADAQGFLHASKIWDGERFDWHAASTSGLGFAAGVALYWGALGPLNALGVASPELQSLVWFAVTLVGVAALSGRFWQWRPLDQAIAIAVLLGVGLLIVRTGE